MSNQPDAASRAPEPIYHQRCAQFAERRAHYARLSSRMANVSITLVVAALACVGVGLWRDLPILFGAAAMGAVGFVLSFAYHTQIDRHHQRYDELWSINDEAFRRLRRDWKTLPLRQPASITGDTHYAADLDTLGHASLQHLLNTAYTPTGQMTLQRWLLEPAAPAEIRARQAAVVELAPLLDFRDELAFHGRQMGGAQVKYELFLRWVEGQPWLSQRPWLVWLTRAMPVITFGSAIADATGLLDVPLWALSIWVHMALILTVGKRADETIERVSARQSAVRIYADLFHLIGTQSFSSPALRRIQADLTAGGLRADQQMRRLARIMVFADFRFFLLFFPINLTTLWNFHVLWFLERWQRTAHDRARIWLNALGEIEALAALATLAYDQPDWIVPTIVEGQPPQVVARGIGHPLLADTMRVANNVAIGPPGTFLLVTGSNMSGKSTLLRAIGTNLVLAQAGGPVCAVELTLPPLLLATSMRVQDSLEQGVSYFMAELQRLKLVVDRAQQTRQQGDRTLLFLLDEILHGTNTSERLIAARQIIRHLLAQGAIGAVSTHDLRLADTPELATAAQLVHFTETLSRGPDGLEMHFDYKLRPGIATSTNALKLMEIVGLPVDALEEQPGPDR
ncbi:MAG TPA: hypothetical protein VFZ66_21455 [Herpetosiphonaceae bacterium]